MNPWTLYAALWLLAAGALAITIGRGIRRADRQLAARQRYTAEALSEARARIVGHYPTITLDGPVPHHIAVRVIRGVRQEEQVGL